MKGFNHILVPVDGSEHALNAAEFAITLANRQTRLTFLTIIDTGRIYAAAMHAPFASPDTTIAEERSAAQAGLERLKDRSRLAGIRAHGVVIDGDPAGAILRYAAEAPIDLIIMNTHGRSDIMRVLMGSVAEAVVRDSPIPVLFAPKQSPSEAKGGAKHLHHILSGR